MKKAYIVAFAILLGLMLVLVGCTKEEISDNQQETEDIDEIIEPVEGGTLNISVTRFNTLNPLYNQNYSIYQLHNTVYESLISFNEKMEVEPLLAKSWVISPDGQTVDLQIREDVKWHDGRSLTVDDVIFTIDLIKGNIKDVKKNTIYTSNLQSLVSVMEVDSSTVRVTFAKPLSNALEVLTFPIIPKHQFTNEELANISTNSFKMIGTGPFKLEKHESTRVLELVRNENYWKSKPYIERIRAVIVPDEPAQLSLFENKDVDIAQPNSIDWAKYLDDKSVNLYEYTSNSFEFLGFNFKNNLLGDVNLRKAIAYGIDRHKLVSDIYLGHGTVANIPINPASWLYDESSMPIGNDTALAIQLLEENYSNTNASGIRVNGGGTPLRFKLLLNSDNSLRERQGHFIKEELKKIGIEVDIVSLEWEKYQNDLKSGNYDLALGGWELSFIPDLSFAVHSSRIGDTNFIYYSNQYMDELLQSADGAPNRTKKLEAYHDLQQHYLEELPYITLFFKDSSVLVRNNIRGSIAPNPFNTFYKIEEWFIVE